MTYRTNFATIDDLPAIEDLINQHHITSSANRRRLQQIEVIPTMDRYIKFINNPITENFTHKIGCCYFNDKLIASGIQTIYNFIPAWEYYGLLFYPGNNYFNPAINGGNELTAFLFEHAEQLGYYQYYCTNRTGKVYKNVWRRMRDQIPTLRRYNFYDIGIIPPNYTKRSIILTACNQPYEQMARTGLLKEEFRQQLVL